MNGIAKKHAGFTIVELLIVIVVIAVLAAVSVLAYSGVQARARDSQRRSDLKTIITALETYYLENGTYPSSGCSSNCDINSAWSTTADGSWALLESQLVPDYISFLPEDPLVPNGGRAGIWAGYNYDYVRLTTQWCESTSSSPMYLLAYRFETSPQEFKIVGNCPGTQPTNYSSSEYIVTKK